MSYGTRLSGSPRASFASKAEEGALIVYLMLAILAALAFLCVSPIISQLASRKPGAANRSKSGATGKHTFQAR